MLGCFAIICRAFLTFFDLFTSTRTLVKMIVEVMYDIIPFMVIVLSSVIGFAIFFLLLEHKIEATWDEETQQYVSHLEGSMNKWLWNSWNLLITKTL